MSEALSVLGFATIPAVAIIIGAFVAVMRTPSARTQSMVQHFAAGVVFAAVAGEVLPDLHDAHAPISTVIGFAIGVAVMLLVKHLVESSAGEGDKEAPRTAKSLLIVVLVDVVIDGILVGVGFAAGKEKGILIMVALTIEVLFLGLATIGELLEAGASRRRAMASACLIAGLLLVGAVIGVSLSLVAGGPFLIGLLAFSAAALLYLVTEELLVEAHEVPETPLSTAVFFVGFIALFLIESAV
jgi:ZIP family zinc transporter